LSSLLGTFLEQHQLNNKPAKFFAYDEPIMFFAEFTIGVSCGR